MKQQTPYRAEKKPDKPTKMEKAYNALMKMKKRAEEQKKTQAAA